jgi:hypothetical protein
MISREVAMTRVEEIEKEIEALPERDFETLRKWFSEKDWDKWDEELESDSQSGKLEFLVNEAQEAKKYGQLRDL